MYKKSFFYRPRNPSHAELSRRASLLGHRTRQSGGIHSFDPSRPAIMSTTVFVYNLMPYLVKRCNSYIQKGYPSSRMTSDACFPYCSYSWMALILSLQECILPLHFLFVVQDFAFFLIWPFLPEPNMDSTLVQSIFFSRPAYSYREINTYCIIIKVFLWILLKWEIEK